MEMAKAFLAEQGRWAVMQLLETTRGEFDELFEEMLDLPLRDVSLQLRLPRVCSPELEALRAAVDDDDDEAVEVLVGPVLAQLDEPQQRAELARAVRALADDDGIDPRVAAVAIADLTTSPSALLRSSLLETLAVSVGAARTPAGLLVVSR